MHKKCYPDDIIYSDITMMDNFSITLHPEPTSRAATKTKIQTKKVMMIRLIDEMDDNGKIASNQSIFWSWPKIHQVAW
jgi:hypothetical protein